MSEFEPNIVGFLCNWCSYAGADLAGTSRIRYPSNIKSIRVMCSGRVDPSFVAEALIREIDGVLVLGCHLGDCHYISGNYEAELKMKVLKKNMPLSDVFAFNLAFFLYNTPTYFVYNTPDESRYKY